MRWFVGWRLHAFNIIASLAVGAFVGGYAVHKWYQAEMAEALRTQLEEANQQIEREQVSDASTQATGEAVAAAVSGVEYRTRTIIREVPVYVTPQADDRCIVPTGFVRVHDEAAASGTAPVSLGTGESPDTPSGVELSTVAATVVDNYGTCGVWREQVIGWQRWYREQAALWATGSATGAASGTP